MAKLNHMARYAIARAYLAGARPCDLAMDYNVSQAYVIAQVNWFQRKQQARRDKLRAAKARQARKVAFPSRPKRIIVHEGRSELARELGIRVTIRNGISLPYVAFLDDRPVLSRPAQQAA